MPYTHEQPPLDELDILQKNAVNRPVNNNEVLIITGCPGSGKTTVENYRVKNSNTQNESVQYLMWTKLLKSYINSVMTTWNPDHCINTIEKWYYKKFTKGRNKAFMTDWNTGNLFEKML